jgi:hypothetical protein
VRILIVCLRCVILRFIEQLTVTHPQPPTCISSHEKTIVVHKKYGQLVCASVIASSANGTVVRYTCPHPECTVRSVVVKFSATNARQIPKTAFDPLLVCYGVVHCDGWVIVMEEAEFDANVKVPDLLK